MLRGVIYQSFLVMSLISVSWVHAGPLNCDVVGNVMLERFSGRSYDASKPISSHQLHAILEAGRLAPSSYNEQPWSFIVCDRFTDPAAFEAAVATLVESNQNWAKHAPVLIIAIAKLNSKGDGKPNRWAPYDTGASSFAMMLEATSLGLMAHQMGGFDETKVIKTFGVPSGHMPMAVMAIGYASPDQAPIPKKRKPLSENFFRGCWGNGISFSG